MEEGVSNLWTMRNDFHPRATAFTSRGSRGIQSFSIHSTSTPEDRLRGGGKEKVGRRRVRIEELEKIGSGRIYYYYYEGY